MVEEEVEGHRVLVPRLYYANSNSLDILASQIVAGKNINLQVASLSNSGSISAGQDLRIQSGSAIENHFGVIESESVLNLQAEMDISNLSGSVTGIELVISSLNGNVKNARYIDMISQSGRGYRVTDSLLGEAGLISAASQLSIEATGSFLSEASSLLGGDIEINAGTIDISGLQFKDSFYYGSNSNYIEQQRFSVIGSQIAGINLSLNSSDMTSIAASQLNAIGKLSVDADDLLISTKAESLYDAYRETRSGLFSQSVTQQWSYEQSQKGSALAGNNIALLARGNLLLQGSQLAADQNLSMAAQGDISIDAAYGEQGSEYRHQRQSFLSGFTLFEQEKHSSGLLEQTAVASLLEGSDISLTADHEVFVNGAQLKAGDRLGIVGSDISIEAAAIESRHWSSTEKLSMGFDDLIMAVGNLDEVIDTEEGSVSLQLGSADYRKAEQSEINTTNLISKLSAAEINLEAVEEEKGLGGNLQIAAASLVAESIDISADQDIVIKNALDRLVREQRLTEAEASISLAIKNEYRKIVPAWDAVKEAAEDLKSAESDQRAYKKLLESQRSRLQRLETKLEQGEGNIEQADVDDFKRYLDDLETDEDYYRANIKFLSVALASKTTALMQQVEKSATSSPSYGFSAGLEIEIDAVENVLREMDTQIIAAALKADSIQLNSASKTRLSGVDIDANDVLQIRAAELQVDAAKSEYQMDTDTREMMASYDMGTSGFDQSIDMSAGMSEQRGRSRGVEHHATSLAAQLIDIEVTGHTEFRSAEIRADGDLSISSGSLEVASIQDVDEQSSVRRGGNVSAGLNEFAITTIENSRGNQKRYQQETVRTRLDGEQTAIRIAGALSIKGATIVATDDKGNDNGKLSITAASMDAESINDFSYERDLDQSINLGNQSGFDYKNHQQHQKTKQLATVGQGQITLTDVKSFDLQRLNRDFENSNIEIFDIESQKGLQTTVDLRLLSEEGRGEIANEFEDVGINVQTVANGVPTGYGGNTIENATGKALNVLSDYSFGLIPSSLRNGGIIAQIPILLGEEDINAGIYQVRPEDDPFVKANEELFIPVDHMPFYDRLHPEGQKTLAGLMITMAPIQYNEEIAVSQVFSNGISNTLPEAAVNGREQTDATIYNIRYNPTRGAIADLLESGVDRHTGLTTGMAKQYGDYKLAITQANQEKGIPTNFANHSQANILDVAGNDYLSANINLKIVNWSDPDNRILFPTVNAYGSPVNLSKMSESVRQTGGVFSGSHVNEGDGVATFLGGNAPGTNQIYPDNKKSGFSDLFGNIFNSKYEEPRSPHSTYVCQRNCGNTPASH